VHPIKCADVSREMQLMLHQTSQIVTTDTSKYLQCTER